MHFILQGVHLWEKNQASKEKERLNKNLSEAQFLPKTVLFLCLKSKATLYGGIKKFMLVRYL